MLKKFQHLCAVRLDLIVLGKVLSQASGFCVLLMPQKSAFPFQAARLWMARLCECVTHSMCGELPAAGAALPGAHSIAKPLPPARVRDASLLGNVGPLLLVRVKFMDP